MSERIRVDAEFASKVAEQLGIVGGAALRTVAEIIENDEDFAVEFKVDRPLGPPRGPSQLSGRERHPARRASCALERYLHTRALSRLQARRGAE